MKTTFSLTVFFLSILVCPIIGQGQTWSTEQQELVDHLHSVWDQIEVNNEATFGLWRDVVNPAEDLVWWFADQGAPYDMKAIQKWHQWWGTREAEYTYMNVRPVAVRVIDSVGMIWFWAYGEWIDKDGERTEWQDQRLEVFRKTSDGWQFVGGMVAPVKPFDGNGDQ